MRDEYKNSIMNTEINNLLWQLIQQIQSILMDKFIGMYVGGSIANNSFNLETSDIDCYIVTSNILSEDIVHKIEEMHKHFYSSQLPYAKKIEASYIPQNDLLNFNPSSTRPYFNEGNFYLGEYGSNFIIELFMLKEKGITITGPDIKKLIKEISIQDLQNAIKKNLMEYWEPSLQNLSKYKRSDYKVFAILTMCRTLYTLEMNSIVSKAEAAKWAMNKLDSKWKLLIEQAIAWQQNSDLNKQEESLEFVRYVINLSRNSA
jgi:Domain of unknown function (DUF4111)